LSFTRTAGYRNASLIKPRPARSGPPLSLADAVEEPVGEALESEQSAAEPPAPSPQDTALASCPRAGLPGASEIAASCDPVFLALVEEGDRHRDAHRWHSAEMAYTAALARFPYQPGYWEQQGHMRKEQGSFFEAEISYRTAAALGVAPDGVAEHLRFVTAKQGIDDDRYPIRFCQAGDVARTAPTEPDVLLLAGLLWRAPSLSNAEILPMLRENATLDDVFAAMVAHPRFAQANIDWLSMLQDGDIA
jgi:hypothetical protein